jgi:spermidine synthase
VPARRTLLAIFLVSGACGLVYEVVWSRLLALAVGAEATAITAVVAAFMGGLALGAHLGGRLAARKGASPLRDYARIELALGLVCLLVPHAIAALGPLLQPAYAAFGPGPGFHAIRAVVCALVLVVPTTLMGATLPVLAPAISGEGPGALYAANTFGAVAGALVAGFVLIPDLGVSATNSLAASGSLSVGVAALFLSRGAPTPALPRSAGEGGTRPPGFALALLGFALSGAAAMAFQIAWTRAFAIILGPTTYAFSLILGAYILGHAIGSHRAARSAPRLAHPLATLAKLELLGAFAALAVVPLVDRLPATFVPSINRAASSFAIHAAAQFTVAFAVIALPAGLFGAAFALVTRALAREGDDGRTTGDAYAANAVGCVAGTILAALLLPRLGIGGTIGAAAAASGVSGALFALASTGLAPGKRLLSAAAALAAAVVAAKLPPWEPLRLNSGAYLYDATGHASGGSSPGDKVLFYGEGFSGSVLVARGQRNGALYMKLDGKVDAGTGAADMRTQLLLGHVPCLLTKRRPARALVVGLGSGVTLRAVVAHGVPSIDLVEIDPVLVEAVRHSPLEEVSHHALEKPGVRILVADARAVYSLERGSYDVIVSEPSNPWIAGIGNLFTREAFALARERLSEDGVFCQWVHAGYASSETFKLVLRTFLAVFPRAALYEVAPNTDYLLVGKKSGEDLAIDLAAASARFDAGVKEDLVALELEDALDVIGWHWALGPEALARFAGEGPLNTDDDARLEYLAPLAMRARLDLLRDPDFMAARSAPPLSGGTPEQQGALDRLVRARRLALEARAAAREQGMTPEDAGRVLDGVEQAIAADPGRGAARAILREADAVSLVGARAVVGFAPPLLARGTLLLERLASPREDVPGRRASPEEEARIGELRRNLARFSDFVPDLVELGQLLLKRDDRDGARRAFRDALEVDPAHGEARQLLEGLGR